MAGESFVSQVHEIIKRSPSPYLSLKFSCNCNFVLLLAVFLGHLSTEFLLCNVLLSDKRSQNGILIFSVQHRHTGCQAGLLGGHKAELSAWPSTTQGQHRSRNKKVFFCHLFWFCSLSLVPSRKQTYFLFYLYFSPSLPNGWKGLMKVSSQSIQQL